MGMAGAVGNDTGSISREDGQVRPHREGKMWGLGGPVAGFLCFQCRGLGLIRDQGTRSHTPQSRRIHATTKDLSTTTEAWCSQINKYERKSKM